MRGFDSRYLLHKKLSSFDGSFLFEEVVGIEWAEVRQVFSRWKTQPNVGQTCSARLNAAPDVTDLQKVTEIPAACSRRK
ncbi:MAG: hypothetical protein KW793_00255 [Candidatus Doudnabacteria bacterium]|nr:hypothetical protein [Candidatus Doudnabacteria bacterium]